MALPPHAISSGRPASAADTNRGTTYTASRYQRLPLPFAPLQEGVAPPGIAVGIVRIRLAHERFGRLAWHALFAPAIHYAEEGFPVTELIAGPLGRSAVLAEQLAFWKRYLPAAKR